LVIWPSPLASICENKSCKALPGLVAAGAAPPVDDWPCAASSALKVAGAICAPPLDPETAVEPPEGGAEISNGLPDADPKPIGCDDDGLEVSDLIASSAADAAPKASSMAKTPTDAAKRGPTLDSQGISKPRAILKKPMK
jgi:hypothetical protein